MISLCWCEVDAIKCKDASECRRNMLDDWHDQKSADPIYYRKRREIYLDREMIEKVGTDRAHSRKETGMSDPERQETKCPVQRISMALHHSTPSEAKTLATRSSCPSIEDKTHQERTTVHAFQDGIESISQGNTNDWNTLLRLFSYKKSIQKFLPNPSASPPSMLSLLQRSRPLAATLPTLKTRTRTLNCTCDIDNPLTWRRARGKTGVRLGYLRLVL